MTNILSNAVKFSRRGKISVSAQTSKKGKVLDIFIRDTGSGIDKKELQNIFEPFHQSNESFGDDVKGTGLGLSISMQLFGVVDNVLV